MVIPTFRDLLKGKSYKTIFNQIYKTYLKKEKDHKIIEISLDIHNLIKQIRQSKQKNNITKLFILTELEDGEYDANFIEEKSDEILSLENLKVEDIIDLEVSAPPKVNEIEILGHIIWHYYGRTKGKTV
jgi:hypothetical protein